MLTQRQVDCLNFISDYQTRTGGASPSQREIGVELGVASASSLHRLLVDLETRGFIRRLRHKHRAIEIIRMPPATPPPSVNAT